MNTMPALLRNLVACVAIAMLFYFASVVAPEPHLKQVNLICRHSSTVVMFADMNACTKDPGYQPGCGCGPVRNTWSILYSLGLIPLLAGLLGYVTLSGSLKTRLAFLNGAVVIVFVAWFIRAALQGTEAFMALPFLPFFAAGLCAIVSSWFALFRFSAHLVGKRSHGI